MFPTAPTIFVVVDVLAAIVVSVVGVPVLMWLFAATLVVTTTVAVLRTIPRREK